MIVELQRGLNKQTIKNNFSPILSLLVFLGVKKFRPGLDADTLSYTEKHAQVILENEGSQMASAAPEMKMIVFLQDPVKTDQSLAERCTTRQEEELPN